MKAIDVVHLPDVQDELDVRGVALHEVGVEGLAYPLTVIGPDGEWVRVAGEVSLVASLAADVRGTHMSRFVEALDRHAGAVEPRTPQALARDLRERLGAERARAELSFPLFVERRAPVSGLRAPLRTVTRLSGESSPPRERLGLGVRVPVTSLCPCSKEISDYGAHSQRGYVDIDVEVRADAELWPDGLVEIATDAGSAPVYPLLKRADERHITMQAYDNPVFVEDVARSAYLALRELPEVEAFAVRVVNEESIHDHRAVARVSWGRSGTT